MNRGSSVAVGNRYYSRATSRQGRGGGGGGGNNYQGRAGRGGFTGGRARDQPNNYRSNNNGNNLDDEGDGAAPDDTEPALRVLSFFEQGSRIAFACYNEEDNEIVFEDECANSGADTERIVRGVLVATRPNLILVANKVLTNAPLLECLTTMPLGRVDGGDSNTTTAEGTAAAAGEGNSSVSAEQQQGADTSQNQNNSNNNSTRTETIPYQLLKSSAFEPRSCRDAILQKLRVLTLMRRGPMTNNDGYSDHDYSTTTTSFGTQPQSNYHSLASVINFDSQTLVRAMGSLLIYLRNTAFRLEEEGTVTVNHIRRCPASDSFLRLDESTLRTLRIFATDHHPLVANINQSQKSKEGFSLFTLLDRTKSKAGRERLRQWMTQPLRDVAKIRQRHVGIELFLHQESHPAASLLLEKLSDIGRMDAILLRMQRCCAQPNDFLQLGRMLDAAYAIVATLSGELREKAHKLDREANHRSIVEVMGCETTAAPQLLQGQYPTVAFIDELLQQCHVPVTRNLRERMATVIDEEVTAEIKDHVVINFGFHDELDRAKETFETLDETLSEVGRQVLAKHEELISLKVVFLPQVGFLVSIDKRQHAHDEATNSFPSIPNDFDFVFVQDNDAFFKNSDMNQLDEEIGGK